MLLLSLCRSKHTNSLLNPASPSFRCTTWHTSRCPQPTRVKAHFCTQLQKTAKHEHIAAAPVCQKEAIHHEAKAGLKTERVNWRELWWLSRAQTGQCVSVRTFKLHPLHFCFPQELWPDPFPFLASVCPTSLQPLAPSVKMDKQNTETHWCNQHDFYVGHRSKLVLKPSP